MRKDVIKTFVPMSAVAVAFGMAGAVASANTPIFEANFPASWDGTSTTVTDQSSAGNTGFQSGTATYSTTAVPSGAAAGTGSMALSGVGGIKVTPTSLLNNTAIAGAGGFSFDIQFMWDGTDSTKYGHTQKLIDYAGTESLELVTTGNNTATLEGAFTADPIAPAGAVTSVAVSTGILANTWYDATLTFNNASLVGGDVTGTANLYLDGVLQDSAAATKGSYGDGLNRPIGIGEWGYGHTTSIIGLYGDIYSASVSLVPEPSALALGLLGIFAAGGIRRRKSR